MGNTKMIDIDNKACTCNKSSRLLDGNFTADELIDAYTRGQQSISQLPSILMSSLNLFKEASSVIKNFYEDNLRGKGCFSIFVRMVLDKISIIAVIDEDLFFDDAKSRMLYKSASDVTRKNKQISISFMACQKEEDINKDALLADNYFEIV
ncbi:hypothetical protein ACGE0T_14255 [Parabacteroides sp. APC149_11_2_Y6]